MNYFLHGAMLALAWFLAIDSAASLLVAVVARRDWTIESARFWLAVRLLPAAAGVLFVAAVFLPGYAIYEPRETLEGFDVSLTIAAAGAAVLIATGLWRALRAWTRAARRSRAWLARARQSSGTGGALPVFEIDSPAPLMALVGLWRPRLVVTRGLLAVLSVEEVGASIAHEVGHSRAWDNVKRLAICAAPDLLPPACARSLERRWAAAAEQAADRHAGGAGASVRCALASALVKVARLMPTEPQAAEPISTLIGGGDIARRVQRLLDDGAPPPEADSRVWSTVAVALGCTVAGYVPLLHAVHQATEMLVNALP